MSGIRGRILRHSPRIGVVNLGEARLHVLHVPEYLICAIGKLLLSLLSSYMYLRTSPGNTPMDGSSSKS